MGDDVGKVWPPKSTQESEKMKKKKKNPSKNRPGQANLQFSLSLDLQNDQNCSFWPPKNCQIWFHVKYECLKWKFDNFQHLEMWNSVKNQNSGPPKWPKLQFLTF